MASVFDKYKLVVKDENGKVLQIHGLYKTDVISMLIRETDAGRRVTVTKLSK